MTLITYLSILLVFLHSVLSYKILTLMTVPSHSHHHWNLVYLKALLERGHEVTYVGLDEYKNPPPKMRYILLEGGYDLYEGMNFTDLPSHGPYEAAADLFMWYKIMGSGQSKAKGVQVLLDVIKTEKFDVVVFDLATCPFLLGAVDILGRPPLVGLTAFGIPSWALDLTSTPYPIAISSHFTYPLGRNLNFFERLENLAFFSYFWYKWQYGLLPSQNEMAKKAFGGGIRSIEEIEADMHINMVNANWATDNAFPLTPGLIPIGGLHIAKPKPLPQEIKQFLESAKDGVIFFSLGSNLQSSRLEPSKVDAMLQAFKRLSPIKVLWKWETDSLPGKPDNVKIGKWLPQNDILSHSSVKLFITHGGMLSSQEAVYHGVPILGIPFMVDQHVNVRRMVSSGIGETITVPEFSPDLIANTIKKIIENPKYKENVVRLSKIFRDDVTSPLDRAVFWTEYAVRHGGAPHLKPPTHSLSWFHTGLYDIALLALATLTVCFYIAYKIIKFIASLTSKPNDKIKKH